MNIAKRSQVSVNRWVDKQNVVYTYYEILFSLKREGNSAMFYDRDKTWEPYGQWNKPVTKSNYEVSRVIKMIVTEGRMLVSGAGERKN